MVHPMPTRRALGLVHGAMAEGEDTKAKAKANLKAQRQRLRPSRSNACWRNPRWCCRSIARGLGTINISRTVTSQTPRVFPCFSSICQLGVASGVDPTLSEWLRKLRGSAATQAKQIYRKLIRHAWWQDESHAVRARWKRIASEVILTQDFSSLPPS